MSQMSDQMSDKMLKKLNALTLAIGGVDTAENEPHKVLGYEVSTAPRPGHGSTGAIRIAQVPQRMADAFEIESFAKGYQILDYGASQDKFYIVSKGSVDLRSDTSSGNRRSVQGYVFSNSESERILF